MSAQTSAERLPRVLQRRLFWTGWLGCGTGAVVVLVATGFQIPIFFDPGDEAELMRENLPAFALLFLAIGTLINWRCRRAHREALAWVVEGREPTEREHRLVLSFSSRTAMLTLAGWTSGGLVMALLNLDHSVGFAVVVLVNGWLAGETMSAMQYLLTERAIRPLTALALAARQPTKPVAPSIRDRLLFSWILGTGVPVVGALVIGIVGMTKPGVETEYVATAVAFLSVVALAVGLLATVLVARAISDPVTAVRAALERVADGDLDASVQIDDGSEVGQLQAGFNRMAEGIRERDRIRDLFGRHVGRDVARAALARGTRLGGEERQVGAVFVDLIGSTSMALAMPPTEVVRLLNRFFRVVIDVVEQEGGLVNKFEGDAALCVFGAPVACVDPAGDALRAARRLCERLERELPEVAFGIGVSAGRAVAGNVGSEARFEYTVIGDPVNEAARLCDLAKERGVRVVASDAALGQAAPAEAGAWEVTDRTVLRGRLDATGVALPRAATA